MGGRRKALVVLSGGIVGRVAMLAWLGLPFVIRDRGAAVIVIIAINALITFANNFANPAWTALVADIVPRQIRGRFFSHRNFAVNLPALLVVPLAGLLIQAGNRPGAPFAGYQIVFALAVLSGGLATFAFARIDDPLPASQAGAHLPLRELTRIIVSAPGFVRLVACTLIWNLGVQMVAPFLNVYLVNNLRATTGMVGWVTAASSLAALLTQRWLGRWVDHRGHLGAGRAFVCHSGHSVVVDAGHGRVADRHYQRRRRHFVDRPQPGQFQPAPGSGAGAGAAEANAIFQFVVAGSARLHPS